MYEELDKCTFEMWMRRLFDRIEKTDDNIKRFALQMAVEEIKVLDNQDMCLLLHINRRTLQRYRNENILKFFNVGGKNYYRVADVKEFMESRLKEKEK